MVDLIVNCPVLTPKGHTSNEWQWAVFLYMEGGMGSRGKGGGGELGDHTGFSGG